MKKIKTGQPSLMEQIKTVRFWKDILIISLAMLLAAAAIYYFLLPGKIVLGSISGLGIVVSELLAKVGIAMKVSTIVLILNIILLVVGYLLIGPEFGVKTTYASLVLGPMMDLCEKICPYERLCEAGMTSMMGDLWFDMLTYILLVSISQAILFHINASTGGLDIIAKLINVFFHMDIGTSVTVAGIATCCTAFFVNPARLVVIGIIGTWLNGLVIDYFMMSLSKKKRVCIISNDHDVIRRYIIEELHRGCSLYEVIGGYKGDKRLEIQSLLTTDEFAKLLNFIRDNEIDAFTTAGNVSEIYGRWSDNKHR